MRREVLFALGFSGRASAAEACLAWLGNDEVGAVAAEAFGAITGLEIKGRFARDRVEPDEEELPPLEEDLEEDLLPGPDDDLLLAEPAAVAVWWAETRRRLDPTVRYLRGNDGPSLAWLSAAAQVAGTRHRAHARRGRSGAARGERAGGAPAESARPRADRGGGRGCCTAWPRS
jgi:hypothetical protein